jgi:hypothetical protein
MDNNIFLLYLISIFLTFCACSSNKETFLDNSIYTGRHTRNMSYGYGYGYDLRGEAYYPPILNLPCLFKRSALRIPFNNSEIYF